jgi:hypothetical protein
MMQGLRDTRDALRYEFPGLQSVERIRRSAAAFEFTFTDDKRGYCKGIRLWRTNLLILGGDRSTQISTGGWHTHTTFKYLHYGLVKNDCHMRVERTPRGLVIGLWDDRLTCEEFVEELEFTDGMII